MPEISIIKVGFEPHPERQQHTPWGGADHVEKLAEGVIQVGTPSHGGIGVENSVALTSLTAAARAEAIVEGGWHWFEEDCDWAIVCSEMPTLFSQRHRELAAESLKRWNPRYLQAIGELKGRFKCPSLLSR